MTTSEQITATAELYAKHGWELRRILVADDAVHDEFADAFPDALIENAFLDAIWFSRRSAPEQEAWELRRLTGSPFALVKVIPDSFTDDEREFILKETETEMRDLASKM